MRLTLSRICSDTHSAQSVSAGVALNVAKELMGHSDISVTDKIYTHMVDKVFEQNRKHLAKYAN